MKSRRRVKGIGANMASFVVPYEGILRQRSSDSGGVFPSLRHVLVRSPVLSLLDIVRMLDFRHV
jgi:hypothetical protein